MSALIIYPLLLVTGAVIGIFIYRNNTDVISSKADQVDKIWDRLGLTDKLKALEDKIDNLSKK